MYVIADILTLYHTSIFIAMRAFLSISLTTCLVTSLFLFVRICSSKFLYYFVSMSVSFSRISSVSKPEAECSEYYKGNSTAEMKISKLILVSFPSHSIHCQLISHAHQGAANGKSPCIFIFASESYFFSWS